jgi:hypothetical protein
VRDVDASVVAMADRESRTGHRAFNPQRPAGTADERRLPGAELARDRDDVPGLQLPGQTSRDLLGLFRRARLDQNRPSCTAGSAATGAT